MRIELCASRQLALLLSVGHLGALAVGATLALSTPGFALVCVGVVLSWYRSLERHALLRSPRSFVALAFEGEHTCALKMRNGRWIQGKITDSSYALPWLIILRVSIERRTFGARVVLCGDSMSQQSHRRLRMRLRWIRYVERTDGPL